MNKLTKLTSVLILTLGITTGAQAETRAQLIDRGANNTAFYVACNNFYKNKFPRLQKGVDFWVNKIIYSGNFYRSEINAYKQLANTYGYIYGLTGVSFKVCSNKNKTITF